MFASSEPRKSHQGSKVWANPKAEALRSETARRQMAAKLAWNPSDLRKWLTEKAYREKIQPRLAGIRVKTIAEALQISVPYATEIGRKKRVPHPRHWPALGQLVEICLGAT